MTVHLILALGILPSAFVPSGAITFSLITNCVLSRVSYLSVDGQHYRQLQPHPGLLKHFNLVRISSMILIYVGGFSAVYLHFATTAPAFHNPFSLFNHSLFPAICLNA
jgi:hypothetical protein